MQGHPHHDEKGTDSAEVTTTFEPDRTAWEKPEHLAPPKNYSPTILNSR